MSKAGGAGLAVTGTSLDESRADLDRAALPGGGRDALQRTIRGPAEPRREQLPTSAALDNDVERQFAARQQTAGSGLSVSQSTPFSPARSQVSSRLPAEPSRYIQVTPAEKSDAWSWLGSALRSVGRFLRDISDESGITDLAVGLGKLASTPFVAAYQTLTVFAGFARDLARAASGEISLKDALLFLGENTKNAFGKIARCMVGGLQAVKGGALVIGEWTGISDLLRCGVCILKGDWAGALAHGLGAALNLGSLVAIGAAVVATGGAGLAVAGAFFAGRMALSMAARQMVKAGCRELFKAAGEALGKELVENISKTLTKEALENAGANMAREGFGAVAKKFLGRDAAEKLLSPTTTEEVRSALLRELLEKAGPKEFERAMAKSGQEAAARLMKEAKVTEKVADLVETYIKKKGKLGLKDFEQEFLKSGIAKTEKEARKLAYHARNVLQGAGHTSDRELAEALTEGIMNPLREFVQAGVRPGYEREMRALLRGAEDAQAEKIIEAGWKGATEGMERALSRAVGRGVGTAIARCRSEFDWIVLGVGEARDQVAHLRHALSGLARLGDPVAKPNEPDPAGQRAHSAHERSLTPTHMRITQRGTALIRQTFEVRSGKELLVAEATLSNSADASKVPGNQKTARNSTEESA